MRIIPAIDIIEGKCVRLSQGDYNKKTADKRSEELFSLVGIEKNRLRDFLIAILVMESFMIGVFCALDLFVFYLFFEAGLIPMFLIIGIWGGPRRVYSAFKFFLFTLLGSVLMLIAIIFIYQLITKIVNLLDVL